MRKNSYGRYRGIVVAVIAVAMFFVGMTASAYAVGLNVNSPSKTQIATQLKNSGVSVNDPVRFDVEPVKNTQKGNLSLETQTSALTMLNNMRYIAGVGSVSLDTTYRGKAQAAAFSNYVIDLLTHYPGTTNGQYNGPTRPKPEGMSDADWNDGKEGARSSNIGKGYSTINQAIVRGWMEDADENNVDEVGHRRWCLNPEMGKTGFGYAGRYTAMWSFDRSVSSGAKRVAWPAQKMPIEFFGNDYPWSLSTGDTSITNISNVSVKLKRRAESPSGSGEWNFSTSNSYSPSDTGAYFGVQKNNPYEGYSGQGGPFVVFRPASITYKTGDIFDVIITGLGSSTISYTVEFFSGFPVESISFDASEYVLTYSKKINNTVLPSSASGYEITWTTGNSNIATVDNDGYLRPVSNGTTTVTATIPGKYTSDGNPRTATATVRVPKSITSSDITVDSTSTYVQYNGSLQKPSITVKDNGVTLTEGEDYIINAPTNAIEPGYYAYSIEGKGSYYGTKNYLYLIIQKKPIDQSMIQLSPSSVTYNGSNQKPSVIVKNGNITLSEGADYTVTNNGGINAGTYTITVRAASGSTRYSGSAQATFTINKKPITSSMVSLSTSNFTYNGSVQKPTVTIKDGSNKLTLNTDYTVTTQSSINSGDYELTVTGKGNYTGSLGKSYTINALDISDPNCGVRLVFDQDEFVFDGEEHKPNVSIETNLDKYGLITTSDIGINAQTYYVTLEGSGNFKGTQKKEFRIVPRQLTADMVTLKPTEFVYNGEIQEPTVSVQFHENAGILTYSHSYESGRDVGTYYATVTIGSGFNYEGSVKVPYYIKPKQITESMFSVGGWTYDGNAYSPTITNNEGVTYSVKSGESIVNAGTHTVVLEGTGNYGGTVSIDYTVDKRSINADEVEISETNAVYTGDYINPSCNLSDINNAITSSDYTVEYTDAGAGINAGNYQVRITGKNNYQGSRNSDFEISRKNIADSDVTINAIPNQLYTGSEITPTLTVKHGIRTLNEDDYDVSYSDNIEVGKATITLTGKGNYTGSKSTQFNIVEKLADPDPQTPVDETDPTAGLSGDDKTKVNDISKALGVTAEEAVAINNFAKANGISMDTLKITEAAIARGNTDSDLKGSAFGQLQAQAKKNTKSAVTLSWKKIPKADGYLVFGNKCGRNNKMKLLKKYTSGSACSFTQKKLKKGTYYKYIVIAYKNIGGKKITINASPTIHTVTKGGKFGVAKSVKVTKVGKKKGAKATVNKGKTAKITAKEVKADKKIKNHRKLAYETSNPKVATVSKKGVVKAIGKGSCKIFVYAQNGKQKTVSITVK